MSGSYANSTQWGSSDNKTFLPVDPVQPTLPPGLYQIGENMRGFFFSRVEDRKEKVAALDCSASDRILHDIQTFWDSEAVFRKYGLAYRRGILAYGPPGSGKTTLLRRVSQDVTERGGVVLILPERLSTFKNGLEVFRTVQSATPVVVLMEDLDKHQNEYWVGEMLNILDGVHTPDKVVFLATTNYIDKIDKRFTNRPSRFDRRIEIGYPGADVRRKFLTFLFNGDPVDDLDKWVESTDKFSMAHLKELFVGVVVLGGEFSEVLAALREMMEIGGSDDRVANAVPKGDADYEDDNDDDE